MASRVDESVRAAAAALRSAGVEHPQREAVALARWALGVTEAWVLAHPERELSPAEEARLAPAVRRRARREPLAYITGRVEFFGLEFVIDHRAIVPRPETEHVVEQALAIAREFDRPLLADIGTGSGCIAIALAYHLEDALVYATDSAPDALELAAANVRRHHLQHRVKLLEGDLLAPLPEPVDVIAANPPYIASGEFPHLMPEVRDYEPRAALDGGPEGLEVIRRLIAGAPERLRAGGGLVMEIGASHGAAVLEMARRQFATARIERDLAGLDRVLVARTDQATPPARNM